ncbi:MAG: hypothetical protein DRI90_04405 [Deltaproteobacteria bacterium]|nr:MAG: hypothetical protein DRI90_04405 [Deltaproteobacteria bacterium]
MFGSCPYDVELCESACDDGTVGRGGCLDAGERHYGKMLAKEPGSTMDKVLHYLERACAGGVPEGCRQQVELRAPKPGLLDDVASSDWIEAQPMLSTIVVDPAVLAARVPSLRKGCKAHPKGNCLLLGKVLLGAEAAAARDAYDRACKAGAPAAICKEAKIVLPQVDRFKKGCDAKDPRACHCLAEVVWTQDPYRAIPLWKRECTERFGQLDERWLYDTLRRAVADHSPSGREIWGSPIFEPETRWDPCNPGVDDPVTDGETAAFEKLATLELGELTVSGVAPEEVTKLLTGRMGTIRRCYARGLKRDPNLSGTVRATFDIDRHGYAVNRRVRDSDLPDRAVITCVLDEIWRLRLPRPAEGGGSVMVPLLVKNKRRHSSVDR